MMRAVYMVLSHHVANSVTWRDVCRHLQDHPSKHWARIPDVNKYSSYYVSLELLSCALT